MARKALLILGWICCGLAVAGVLLPLVPATPFVLLAAVCFRAASPDAYRQLLGSPLLGPVLRDWQERRGMRLSAKITALLAAGTPFGLTLAFWPHWIAGLLSTGLCLGVVLTVVFCTPTLRVPSQSQ